MKKSNSCIVGIHEREEMMIKEMLLILGKKWMPMTVELQTDISREHPQQNFYSPNLKSAWERMLQYIRETYWVKFKENPFRLIAHFWEEILWT